ncbi:MAG: ABC transporter permease [Corynebacterium sp.]
MTAHTSTQPFNPDMIQVHRPGASAWLKLIVAEAKMVIRDTAGLIIPLGMPLLIMVMQAPSVSGATTDTGHSALEFYVLPVVFAMVIATIAVINMPSFLATYRKMKVLRRLAVTPASPAMVLVAQMVVSVIQVLIGIGIGIAYLVAVIFWDAGLPDSLLMAVLVLVATFAAMYALGMIVTSVAPHPQFLGGHRPDLLLRHRRTRRHVRTDGELPGVHADHRRLAPVRCLGRGHAVGLDRRDDRLAELGQPGGDHRDRWRGCRGPVPVGVGRV